MLRVVLYLIPVALAIYALVDLVQTDDKQVQGLPKLAWGMLIVLTWIIGIGAIAWLIGGKKDRRWFPGLAAQPPTGPGGGGRQLAPDDDPDFLRGLGPRTAPPPRPSQPDDRPSDSDGDDPPVVGR